MNARAKFLLNQLPDIGEGIAAAFVTLHRNPLPDSADELAIRLDGARTHLLRLAYELTYREETT